MTPAAGQRIQDVRTTSPIPGWVAIVSIMLGIAGLLYWGWQGIDTLRVDMAAMEAAGLKLSDGHRSILLVSCLVNVALAILLLVGGLTANAGNQLGAAALLRGWSWLKLAAVAAGLAIAWAFFDDLVMMNRFGVEEALAPTADDASTAAPPGAPEGFSDALFVRLSIAVVVLQAALLSAWPCVVLAVVPTRSQLEGAGQSKATKAVDLPERES